MGVGGREEEEREKGHHSSPLSGFGCINQMGFTSLYKLRRSVNIGRADRHTHTLHKSQTCIHMKRNHCVVTFILKSLYLIVHVMSYDCTFVVFGLKATWQLNCIVLLVAGSIH